MQKKLPFLPVLFLLAIMASGSKARSQEAPAVVDSIYFHLYTDSLKKQVYNYINVDAKLSNGRWRPLSSKDVDFKANAGKWDGNSIIIDTSFKGEYVDITATLKANPALVRSVRIYIKKKEDSGVLKTEEEVLREYRKKKQ
ncbi:hypothetical protein [Filimonas effusa]|uniref:DUF3888 domain-containing protein n=1 Tax=Filimonas effusa TaxID=2508721 RepID=A0A4Q1D880_9BACT|nr:hypothetical protein [Filimonas effusa]RXK85471.1 hypothetical protein ESB13_01215 [Filimonas effusa]